MHLFMLMHEPPIGWSIVIHEPPRAPVSVYIYIYNSFRWGKME
jgi:hypothetical protein